jgi:hypothetical protein
LFLNGFTDSDLAGDLDGRKSTSGVVFLLSGNIISCSSQKQKAVATSSCEAEYIAAASGASQGVWLSRLLGDMVGKTPEKFSLKMDNESTIALAKNPIHHDISKHIDTKYHYIRSCVEDGKADVEHIGTNDQLADLLTKALG